VRIRRYAAVAATTGVAISSSLFVGVATASADSQPCGAGWSHPEYGSVQTCPDWSPVGEIPVLAHTGKTADLVGSIDPAGPDWYICQVRAYPIEGPTEGIANDWWAVTVADNGEPGVVPQIFFKGGANYEPDGGLRHC